MLVTTRYAAPSRPVWQTVEALSNLSNFPLPDPAEGLLAPANVLSGSQKALSAEAPLEVASGVCLACSGLTTLLTVTATLDPMLVSCAPGFTGASLLLEGAQAPRRRGLKLAGGALMLAGANLLVHAAPGGTTAVAAGAFLNVLAVYA